MTGQAEAADLPAIDQLVVGQASAAQRHAPEGRRLHLVHHPAGDDFPRLDAGRHRRFVDFLLPDAGRMDIGFVGEVHQIVDHQPIVAGDMKEAAAIGPLIALRPRQRMQLGRVRPFGVSGPDPDEAVALKHRKGADGGKIVDALARHAGRPAGAADRQPMIAAHQIAATHEAQRKRRAAVRAEILQRRDATVGAAIEYHGFAANLAREGLVGQLIGGAGDIPGVAGPRLGVESRFHRISPFAPLLGRGRKDFTAKSPHRHQQYDLYRL